LAAGVLIAVIAVVFGFAPSPLQVAGSKASAAGGGAPPQRTLSLEERVRYQRAVEEVYWRHTVWPKQNAEAKPTLDEVASLDVTRARVEDGLRKSDALARQWNRPVTAGQLQAEVARMARETRRPGVLRELWQALDNDPLVVAEVLARPVLVERLARTSYASDRSFHGALRAKAEAQLREHTTLDTLRRHAGGKFSQIEAVKVARKSSRVVGGGGGDAAAAVAVAKGGTLELTAAEWNAETARLREMFGAESCEGCGGEGGDGGGREAAKLPVGGVSRLQEDDDSFYVTSIVASAGKRLKVARVEWPKVNFDSWWSGAGAGFDADAAAENFVYKLAEINPRAADDTWTPTKALPVATGTVVWTGTEMIIWGGQGSLGGRTNSGARYNPSLDTWTPTAVVGAPAGRRGHVAVWTGTEMIVWSGCGANTDFCGLSNGGRYNPASDTWAAMSNVNGSGGRSGQTAVWTGSKMIVFGGCSHGYNNRCTTSASGGVYDPAADAWSPMTATGGPGGRVNHRAVWTGSEMIVWGPSNTGGRYNPASNSWTPTNTFNAPSARTGFTAVWSGTEMIIWGGYEDNFVTLNTGGRYNPQTDSWTPTSTTNTPAPRYAHTAVWTGTEMVVYGGDLRSSVYFEAETNTGGRYNPQTDSWTATSTTNAPPKAGHVAVWTGAEMIVWSTSNLKSGGRYNPQSDSWRPTDNNDSPSSVEVGVWTGAEMIVWSRDPGCISGCDSYGARYNPATYSWRPMSLTNAPPPGVTARVNTAVWTGTEMIVWGQNEGHYTTPGEGGRYNPQSDTWARTTTTNAPVNRTFHAAVWTGTEMIVWGGESNEGVKQNTGGRYDPATDSWRPTSTANAPTPRYIVNGVWTGAEMFVWGGIDTSGYNVNTGGRYDPATDSWRPTSTTGAPVARRDHTTIWTGAEAIIWGGTNADFTNGAGLLNTGGRYNPASDSWTPTSMTGVPTPRDGHTAIWTGSHMIVWGGYTQGPIYVRGSHTGARYNAAADAWTPVSTHRAPSARSNHLAFWTGTGMLVWGGYAEEGAASHGGYYSAPGASSGNAPPAVRVSAPADNATFESGANIDITAETSDTDGAVSSVHFYAGDALIGSDSTAPFGFTWPEVRGGVYTIKAVATDDAGGVNTSAPVRFSVNPSTAPPSCVLNTPVNGATYTPPASLAFMATASANRDRKLTTVQFFDGNRSLGTFNYNPAGTYEFNYGGLQNGTYTFTVRCTDSAGVAVTTPPTVVTVSDSQTTTVRITGQIVNSQGSAVSNLRVRLDSSQNPTPQFIDTNLNGVYQFGGLPAGANYTVRPESTTYTFSPPDLYFHTLSQNYDSGNFTARNVSYSIGGRLTDAGGNAIYPATVNLSGSKTASAGTDFYGNYYFTNLEAGGTYTLQPYKNQYNFTPPARTFTNLSAQQTADFTGTVTTYTVSGRVTAAPAAGGAGLAGVSVTLSGTATFTSATDANGGYSFSGLVGGNYSVTPSKDNYDFTPRTQVFTPLSGNQTANFTGAITGGQPARTNVALSSDGATILASSVYSAGYPAASLNNGDRRGMNWEAGGGWNDATPARHPDWVEVRFGGARALTEVDVFTVQDEYANPVEPTAAMTFSKYGATDFAVEYWDGAAWAAIPGASVAGNGKVWVNFSFPTVTTNRIRVVITGALAGYSRLTEVEAWQQGAAPPPPPPSQRTNVALAAEGAKTLASSVYSASYPASAVNDGDRRGTNWEAGGGWNDATLGGYPDWIEVAFAGSKTIDEIGVFTLQDNYASPAEPTAGMTFSKYGVTDFAVEYWDGAASAWREIPGARVVADRLVWRKFTFPAVTTTKIRVVINGALEGYSRIAEVEAWQAAAVGGGTPARPNLALASAGATTFASSAYGPGYPVSAINDGDRRGTNWEAGGGWNDATLGGYPDWVEVRFGGARALTEVNVFTVQDNYASPAEPAAGMLFTQYGVTDFEVQYWDGTAWVAVPNATVAANNQVWRNFTFTAVTSDRIRVWVTGALAGYSRLTEVEAYQ
jgi:N-acetylneuraminic acid mutarotase